MNKPSFVYVIYIASTLEKVWAALTNGDLTKEYWAHRNVSDWKVGSRWEHQRVNDASKVDVFGKIIESVPPRRLVMTWDHPANSNGEASISRVLFEIEQMFNDVRLTVTHDELSNSQILRDISQGWPAVLSSLKSFLETGRGLEMVNRWTEAAQKQSKEEA